MVPEYFFETHFYIKDLSVKHPLLVWDKIHDSENHFIILPDPYIFGINFRSEDDKIINELNCMNE